MKITTRATMALIPLVLTLAACSSGSSGNTGVAAVGTSKAGASASASSTANSSDAQLAYAQCLREHGVPVKDPAPGQPVRITNTGSGGGDMAALQAATKACAPLMQSAAPQDANGNDPKVHDQLVQFATCMRKNGVDIPDPAPGAGLQMTIPEGSQAKAQAAQKTCNHFLPGSMQQGGTMTGNGGQ